MKLQRADMDSYSPISDQHAVDQAVVGIRFHRQADDEVFRAAVQLAQELAEKYNLPGRVQLDPLALTFGKQVISHGYAAEAMLSPGLVFQRVQPSGAMAEELTLERGAVTYRTHSYLRWKDVVDLLEGIVCPVASVLSSGNAEGISVIELRCIDKFTAKSSDRLKLNQLIRKDSPFAPSIILDKQEMLHVHTGWFQNETDAGRTLVNLNIDVVDNPDGNRVATILQVISMQYSGSGVVFNPKKGLDENIICTFNELHAVDKDLLKNLITDELQAAINLFGSGAPGQ